MAALTVSLSIVVTTMDLVVITTMGLVIIVAEVLLLVLMEPVPKAITAVEVVSATNSGPDNLSLHLDSVSNGGIVLVQSHCEERDASGN